MVDYYYRLDRGFVSRTNRGPKDAFAFNSRIVSKELADQILLDRDRNQALLATQFKKKSGIFDQNLFDAIFPPAQPPPPPPPPDCVLYHVHIDHSDTTPSVVLSYYTRDWRMALKARAYIIYWFGKTVHIDKELVPCFDQIPDIDFWVQSGSGRIFDDYDDSEFDKR